MRASFTEEKERNLYSRFTNPNTSPILINYLPIILTPSIIKKYCGNVVGLWRDRNIC
jgi:hypothetical protein